MIEFSFCMKMMSVFVHRKVYLTVKALNENRMPMLIIQKAAQCNINLGIRRMSFSITLKEEK